MSKQEILVLKDTGQGLNSCHNRPKFKPTYMVQDGYANEDHSALRTPFYVKHPHDLSTDCQYSILTEDPRCTGCKWKADRSTMGNDL